MKPPLPRSCTERDPCCSSSAPTAASVPSPSSFTAARRTSRGHRTRRPQASRNGPTISTAAPTPAVCTPSAGVTPMAAVASSTRCATRLPTIFSPPTGWASARRSRRAAGRERRARMSAQLRIPSGGRVDRARPLNFRFDGRSFRGLAGDTLASALLANGVHLIGRSFKYHRPRGILAAGAEEPNALVTVRRDAARYTPNLRATQVELYPGLAAHSQNRFPTLSLDVGAVNDLISPFIPAGFYYKTFMWPSGAWKSLYEPRIRAAAGLGNAPTQPDPDRYTGRFAHCDVLVVGAGPAGLAAARAAAASGARVMLCDEQNEPGGSLLSDGPDEQATLEGRPVHQWLRETLAALAGSPRVTLLPRKIGRASCRERV